MRRLLRILLVVVLLGAVSLLGLDLRRHGASKPGAVELAISGHGPLQAGGGKAELAVPYPIVGAGYGPRDRHEVAGAAQPQLARAIALQSGDAKLTLVSVDLLEIDEALPGELAAELPGETWLCATHTHTGMGAYDPNLLAQVAAAGRYRPEARAALKRAIVEAAKQAWTNLAPAQVDLARGQLAPNGVHAVNRSNPEESELGAIARLDLVTARGGIHLLTLAAHPTRVPRFAPRLDGDYPAGLTQALETEPGQLDAFFQGAGGDTSLWGIPRELPELFHALAAAPQPVDALSFARVSFPLPPIQIHEGPGFTRRGASNLVDWLASPGKRASVSIARIGPATLIAVPGEPTVAAGRALREAALAPDALVFGLCNGYLGYVERPDRVRAGRGESKRQYFDASLLERLSDATQLAAQALEGRAR